MAKRCYGWVSSCLGPQHCQLICGLKESFWKQDSVCVARHGFRGYQLVENVEGRGRMSIFHISLAGVAARYAGFLDSEAVIT